MSAKHLQEVIRRAQVPVVAIRRTGGGHWRIETPGGPIFTSSTPGDRRATNNAIAMLRRANKAGV